MTHIQQLFEYVRNNALHLRESIDNSDGRAFWQIPKNHLKPYDNISFTWLAINNDYSSEMLSLVEYTIDGKGVKTMNQGNHFRIQTARICLTKSACVRNLIQIALNLGMMDQETHDRSSMEIYDYVSPDDLVMLNTCVPYCVYEYIREYTKHYFTTLGLPTVGNV